MLINNGHYRDLQGRLVLCSHGGRRIERTEKDGSFMSLVARYQGKRLGKILVPEKVANCTFGGPQRDELYIAASSSLYRIRLNTRGLQQS